MEIETKEGMNIQNFISQAIERNFIISKKPLPVGKEKEILTLSEFSEDNNPDWVLINKEKNIILLVNEKEGQLSSVNGILNISYSPTDNNAGHIESTISDFNFFEKSAFKNGLMQQTIYPSITNNFHNFMDTIDRLPINHEKIEFSADKLEVIQGFENASKMPDYQLQFYVSKVLGTTAVGTVDFESKNKLKVS
jgi:hypothetical protein